MTNKLKTYEVVIGYNHCEGEALEIFAIDVEAKDKLNAVLEATRNFCHQIEFEDSDDFIYPVCHACIRSIKEVRDNG